MSIQIRGRQILDSTITAAKLVLSDDFDFSSGTVSVASPSSANHAASKSYVDSAIQGVTWKEAVRVRSTANVSVSSAPAAIDGVTMASGDRVLLTAQSAGGEDGIYVYNGAGAAMTRAADADPYTELDGAAVFIKEGTSADEGFVQTASLSGYDDQVWVQFSGAGNITAGDGLAKSGNTLSVNVDDSSIEINSDSLRIKSAGVTNAMLANSAVTIAGQSISLGGSITADTIAGQISSGTITNAQLAGSIANAKLENSTVSFGGVSVALGASDSTPAFDLADATNYPTSSLVGTITNAQLAGSIDANKLLLDSANFERIDDGSFALKNTSVSNAQLAGSIANAKLANSSITIAGSATALGGSISADTIAGQISSSTITSAQLAGSIDANKLLLDSANFERIDDGSFALKNGSVSNDQLAGSIANAKLENSSVSFGGVSLSLGGSDATPAFNLADATGYPTSSLVGTVTNAQLAGSIAAGKLLLDSAVLEAAGNDLTIKIGSINNDLIAADTISTAKLGYQGYYESFTANGSTAGFDLARAIKTNLAQSFVVTVNGLVMDYKASPDSKDNFKIDNTGASSVGKITFGANLDNGDKVAIRYVA